MPQANHINLTRLLICSGRQRSASLIPSDLIRPMKGSADDLHAHWRNKFPLSQSRYFATLGAVILARACELQTLEIGTCGIILMNLAATAITSSDAAESFCFASRVNPVVTFVPIREPTDENRKASPFLS